MDFELKRSVWTEALETAEQGMEWRGESKCVEALGQLRSHLENDHGPLVDNFWTMLQEIEAKVEPKSDAVLKLWVEQWFSLWNRMTGQNHVPRWNRDAVCTETRAQIAAVLMHSETRTTEQVSELEGYLFRDDSQAVTPTQLRTQRDLLATELGRILMVAGVVPIGTPLTGPQLLVCAREYRKSLEATD